MMSLFKNWNSSETGLVQYFTGKTGLHIVEIIKTIVHYINLLQKKPL